MDKKQILISAPDRWIKESKTPYNQKRIAQAHGHVKPSSNPVRSNATRSHLNENSQKIKDTNK